MDLQYTADELDFRDQVRRFLKAELPPDISERVRNGHAIRSED
jgi:hypothetical protein